MLKDKSPEGRLLDEGQTVITEVQPLQAMKINERVDIDQLQTTVAHVQMLQVNVPGKV